MGGETYLTMLDASFRSGTPPDISIPSSPAVRDKLVRTGWVMPLDDVAPSKEELQNRMAQFARKITELGQGKVYGIIHGIKDGSWDQDLYYSLAPAAGWASSTDSISEQAISTSTCMKNGRRGAILLCG